MIFDPLKKGLKYTILNPLNNYIIVSNSSEVEKILKGSLDFISSPSSSVKTQISMGRKVCLRCKGKTLLGVVNNEQTFENKKFVDITQQCFTSIKLSRQ